MRIKSHITLVITTAVLAFCAPAAFAMPADLRGEHSKDAVPAVTSSGGSVDLRTPDAVEPFVRPVIVEVGKPVPAEFDWSAVLVGLGAGAALVLLAVAGVAGSRRRQTRPTIV